VAAVRVDKGVITARAEEILKEGDQGGIVQRQYFIIYILT